MAKSRADGSRPAFAGVGEPESTPGEFKEMRERVMARVAHLSDRRQVEIERAVRILRAYFINRRDRAPRQGTLHWLMLVGDYAGISPPCRDDGDCTNLEIWAFVDHEVYKGLDHYWGHARHVLERELRGRAAVALSVFTIDEVERFRTAGNAFLADRYDGGVILYDRAMDCPRDAERQAAQARLTSAVADLPEVSREAFRYYREHGLRLRHMEKHLSVREARAEMALSDAFGTLLANLGDDALPRSLRPRLPAHPRHNLDLYHRPADFDRTLAVKLYRLAVAFAETMDEEDAPAGIVILSAAYAAEFALKSFLLHGGYFDDWSRSHIGLDIGIALAEVTGAGLPGTGFNISAFLETLTRFHRDGRTPPLRREVIAAAMVPDIITAIGQLLNTVGKATGYLGLPTEGDA
jgi:DNA-directed RNA polymerase specialized sigma24 family protein